jgi:hypothetical protein
VYLKWFVGTGLQQTCWPAVAVWPCLLLSHSKSWEFLAPGQLCPSLRIVQSKLVWPLQTINNHVVQVVKETADSMFAPKKKKKNCRLHGISNFVSPKCQQRKFTILDTTIVKTLPDFLFKRTSLNYPRFCFLLLFEGEFSSLPPQLGLRGTYQHSCGCQTHP